MRTRSPFPGMDPWLESYWESIHHSYISDSRAQIAAQLPEGLFCELEETVYIVENDQPTARVRPDLAVFGQNTAEFPTETPSVSGGVAVATPVRFKIAAEPIAEMHIVIRSLRGNQPLVTVIEVISPTNKLNAPARRKYKQKRRAYQAALANIVEIDLLRAGRSLIERPSNENQTPYAASVRLRADPELGEVEGEFYPLSLRARLPRILIPLRLGDSNLVLDLQRPIDKAYELGRYGTRIDYSKPPDPPLSTDDAAWAAELIAAI